MRQALNQAEKLLRDYGRNYEANLVAIALETFDRDPQAACREINSDEWWNGTAAVAAVDLAVAGGFTAKSRMDAQALRQALLVIFTTMRAYGEHNTAGEIVVSQFRKWRESHI